MGGPQIVIFLSKRKQVVRVTNNINIVSCYLKRKGTEDIFSAIKQVKSTSCPH